MAKFYKSLVELEITIDKYYIANYVLRPRSITHRNKSKKEGYFGINTYFMLVSENDRVYNLFNDLGTFAVIKYDERVGANPAFSDKFSLLDIDSLNDRAKKKILKWMLIA